MDPIELRKRMNPSVFDARELCTEYIIYYGDNDKWQLERISDKKIMARGCLRGMLSLITRYPNVRRATWAEDTLHYPYKGIIK